MWIYLLIVLVVLILVLTLFQGFKKGKVNKACDFIAEGAPILDTRTREEYDAGHVTGAILIETPLPPLSDLQMSEFKQKLLAQNLASKKAVVYCKKGIRSTIAQQILEDEGVSVVNLCGIMGEPLRSIVAGTARGSCLRWTI